LPGRKGPQQARILDALRTRGEVPVDDLVREGGREALRRLVRQGAVLVKDPPPDPRPDEPSPERSAGDGSPTLLWGDPGARRAWILAQAQAAVDGGGQALIIVPEIVRVPAFLRSLGPVFGDAVLSLHSALTARERQDAWERSASRDVRIVVGTRSALFAPL